MKTKILNDLIQTFKNKSILWSAVMYAVLLSALIIISLSAVSYLFMTSLIQQDLIQVNVYVILENLAVLGKILLLVGILFFALAIVLSFSFARNLTKPIMQVRKKVEKMKTGTWKYKKTLHSGDEIEQLDNVMAVLTKRLRKMYSVFEDEAAKKTDQLEKEFEKDQVILNAINIGLIVVDEGGTIMDMNPAAIELLKEKKSNLLGIPITKAMNICRKGNLVEKKEHPVIKAINQRKEIDVHPRMQLEILCKKDMHVPVRLSATPLMQNKEIWGALVLFQDVTAERQLDSMKAEFISLASHNLRMPLASIQWYLELMTGEFKGKLTKDQKSYIKNMQDASEKMVNIVSELMDASRLQEGGILPALKSVDVKKLIEEVINGLQVFMNSKQVKTVVISPGAAVKMNTDPVLLSVVVQNLLHNAIKYSRKNGQIDIKIKKSKDEIVISVHDRGIGISTNHKDRIFEKLFRAENAQKIDPSGTGLGLFFCRIITEKLGGSIDFLSKEGKGTTFTVKLPMRSKK